MEKDHQKRPNVIVFFTDQQRWDTSGLHGNPLRLMPNFDRMALQGTHLTHSFTCQPVCGPARSCLQTGKYATTTGCFVNGIHLPEQSKTLAHYFREAGYQTGYIGKWHLAKEEPVTEPRRGGYEYWLASDVLEFTSDAYNTVMYNNENEPVKLPGYRVDAITDAAIRYIDGHQEEPFYLFLSYLEPHHQNHLDDYPAPDGYREMYTGAWLPPDLAAMGGSAHQHIAGYYGMVKRLDEALGRLLDSLKSLHLDSNTIVLFTSDHGCHFKTRNAEYKRSVHDASLRVPTAITGPGFFGGRQLKELVSLIDLPPTLLEAAGIPVPADMQGRSVLQLLQGETVSWPEEVFVQISESEVGRAVRTRRWKYGVTAPEKNPFLDAGSSSYEETYLYDLQADPYELTNLIGLESHRVVADVMKERLRIRMKEAGEAVPNIISAPARPGGQRRVTQQEELA
ncbi:sulfatase-like hydrolase/transferase [Paenibacillus filicis]|uniref:Sulfatase-like hydrolase/transferase n=1 Tax=Paenibacillus gyeongsangnamensis TaxID=3388067 RepID=A0ABT4QA08_9BACL|nr:sulfatase-like hydrolase/transferase [Paenibacillus filicis]MCZ8513716.1 sulfatase-like hydrolase/transferase [Paenibacillus filicis]